MPAKYWIARSYHPSPGTMAVRIWSADTPEQLTEKPRQGECAGVLTTDYETHKDLLRILEVGGMRIEEAD